MYSRLAENMLEGHGFSQCVSPPYTPSIARTPAYPAFLASVYFFFGKGRYEVVRVLQIGLMLFAAFLVFKIAMLVTGNRIISFGALLFTSLYGYKADGAGAYGFLMTEPLTIVFVNASIYVMFCAINKKSIAYYAILGVLLAVTMLIRPSNLFFPVAVALFLFITQPTWRMAKCVVVMVLITAAVVGPWTIRNYRCFNVFIPLSVSLQGAQIFQGAVINNPDFMFDPGRDYRLNGFAPTESQQKRINTAFTGLCSAFAGSGGTDILVYDDSLKAVGLEIIKENKIAFVKKWFFRILGHWNFADVANRLNGVNAPIGPVGAIKIVIKLLIVFIVGFGIFRYWRNVKLMALLLFPFYNTLVYTPFTPQLRYSFPSRSFVIILFAMGLWEIIKQVCRKPVFADFTAGFQSKKNVPLS